MEVTFFYWDPLNYYTQTQAIFKNPTSPLANQVSKCLYSYTTDKRKIGRVGGVVSVCLSVYTPRMYLIACEVSPKKIWSLRSRGQTIEGLKVFIIRISSSCSLFFFFIISSFSVTKIHSYSEKFTYTKTKFKSPTILVYLRVTRIYDKVYLTKVRFKREVLRVTKFKTLA